ncbi:hypothetical protein PoB_003573600 [Plakobranchus ocellatus]|uniref:Uncharacterized protein n=1 Tax=Plakobranchus ocellatus TaxID=259542 RepID=A0AAV4AM08_9GAST|nr:hypothetical protein PoB_003573600 [Plakobranchus ocellatus]
MGYLSKSVSFPMGGLNFSTKMTLYGMVIESTTLLSRQAATLFAEGGKIQHKRIRLVWVKIYIVSAHYLADLRFLALDELLLLCRVLVRGKKFHNPRFYVAHVPEGSYEDVGIRQQNGVETAPIACLEDDDNDDVHQLLQPKSPDQPYLHSGSQLLDFPTCHSLRLMYAFPPK